MKAPNGATLATTPITGSPDLKWLGLGTLVITTGG
jgi:hypothetical protein